MDGARIQQLIHAAAEARQGGRVDDAGRLLRQAELEAPRHPQVLNEVAVERLAAGDSLGAYQVLTEAVKAEPSNPSLWLNLAAALRGLARLDEEMAALQRVLAIEPRNLRALLQKASLLELQNKPRAAAAAYRTALQSLAPGMRTPPGMDQVLVHARAAVDANNRALEGFLEERLTTLRARYADQPLRRFDRCLATLVQKERIYRQQPSFMYFPYLPVIEFYERSDFVRSL
jgi:aspartate beta-hydroxylase